MATEIPLTDQWVLVHKHVVFKDVLVSERTIPFLAQVKNILKYFVVCLRCFHVASVEMDYLNSLLFLVQVCPRFTVVNGNLLGFGTQTGSVVRVECNRGYNLLRSDLQFRKCGSNGQWTGGNSVQMQCKSECRLLINIAL